MNERQFNKKFRQEIEQRGGIAFIINPEGNTGLPDLFCKLPHWTRGVFCELKMKKGYLSPKQKWWKGQFDNVNELLFVVWHENDKSVSQIVEGVNQEMEKLNVTKR